MLNLEIWKILSKNYALEIPINQKNITHLKLLKKFLQDKRNASLGDSLINFVYSCAKSVRSRTLSSNKVSDTILVNGYKNSKLKGNLSLTGDKKKVGDSLEALILLVWVKNLLTLEEMTSKLFETMNNEMFAKAEDEKHIASLSFTRLFNIINNLIFDND